MRALNVRKYNLWFFKSCCEVRILNPQNFHAVRKKAGGISITREKLLSSPTQRPSPVSSVSPCDSHRGMADTNLGNQMPYA